MDTSLFDEMFPESPTEDDLPLCNTILFTLRSKGTSYEAKAWRDLAEFLKDYPQFETFQNHFIKIADRMDKQKGKSKKEVRIEIKDEVPMYDGKENF